MDKIVSFNQLESSKFISGLEEYKSAILNSFEKIKNDKIVPRIWGLDYSVWKNEPGEISNRLGWLQCPFSMGEVLSQINHFVDQVRAEGFTHALLLGMGGSSLAPEVIRKTFGVKEGYLNLFVLDSTHPDAIKSIEDKLNISKTLFIVSTKSGGTVETMSLMKYFYNKASENIGQELVGKHFIAITDSGSGLESLARSLAFRKIFLNDPNIGGRYSALSFFGLVPAALLGVNIKRILEGAIKIAEDCKSSKSANNPGVWLGTIMGELAIRNREKITFILSEELKYLGLWLEQLIAESTGKEGIGILPIDGEEILNPENYSDDRLFVIIQYGDKLDKDMQIKNLSDSNIPLLKFYIKDLYELGAEIFRWEFATIIASKILEINPFDQPNVESAKILAREMVAEYIKKGNLPTINYNYKSDSLNIFSDISCTTVKECMNYFFENISDVEKSKNKKVYVSLHAYLNASKEIDSLLRTVRSRIQKKWDVATTVGYGPRFLHSTGQLHKGDAGNGLFIQIIDLPKSDMQIPDEAGKLDSSISFSTLILSQALGDRQALLNESRNVILINCGINPEKGLNTLLENI